MEGPKIRAGVRIFLLGFLALIGASPLAAQVTITEILYNYGPSGEAGRRREFVELFNTAPEPIDLSGWFFSRGLNFTFPDGTWLYGSAYLAVCADPTLIRTTYSITNVAGPWDATTALANGGETIALAEPSGVEIVKVKYNDRGKWPAGADGTGHSLAITSPYRDPDDPDSWALSSVLGGSPGKPNPTPPVRTLIINEGLILTSGPKWVEFYNPTGGTVNITNYYITDDPLDLKKARLGTVSIPGRSWKAFSDTELTLVANPLQTLDFTPDAEGRTFIALVHSTGTRVVDAYNFEPHMLERSEACFPDGGEDWSPAATPTRELANAVQVEENVVINEIMYHPIGDDSSREYVELYNRGPAAVFLDGCRFDQGINFDFPSHTSIPSHGYLVVARNPDKIRAIYGLPASQVIGPAQDPDSLDAFGVLSNGGERLSLVDALGNVMDAVHYRDSGDWPKWADGLGSSLELIDPFADNSVGSAWDASDDSAKARTTTFSYSGRHVPAGESELHLVMMNTGIAVVDDIEVRSTGSSVIEDKVLIPFGASLRYFKGTQEPSNPVTVWRGIGFDAGGWTPGQLSIGYGTNDPLTEKTELTYMQKITAIGQPGYLTVFFRITFNVTDKDSIDKLFLEYLCDDGFFAWLNGTPLPSVRVNLPNFDSTAASTGPDPPTLEPRMDITGIKSALVNGTNVLAVQVHNYSLTSSDLYFDCRLYTGRIDTSGQGPNLIVNGTFDQDDSGWIIEGNHIESGRTTVDPIDGPGSLKLIATGRGDNKVNRIETETSPSMNGTDTYNVSFKARWVVGSRTIITHDYQNLDTSLAASHQLEIPENLGTPGTVNSATQRLGPDMGPTISKVSHSPSVPQGGEAVSVRAKIADLDGVASAKVKYYVDSPGIPEQAPPQPVGIFDDHQDVGGPCAAGSTTSANLSTYTVTGGGDDIWQGGDQFQFAYLYAQGDFTMTARFAGKSWAPGSTWGKVGIMARQSLSGRARYAFVHDSGEDPNDPNYYARFAGRPTDGGGDNFESGIGAAGNHPLWIRLARQGTIFRGYGSANGSSWTSLGDMNWGSGAPGTVLLGLAVTSHAGCPTTAIAFDNVTFVGTRGSPPDPGGGPCTETSCEVAMTDPDGDGIYTAVIPGLPLGKKVLFSIEATDGNGNLERFPPDVTQRAHPLLLDPTTTDPAVQSHLIYQHDVRDIDPGATSYSKYRLVLDDLSVAYLDERQTLSNDPVEGSFIFGSQDLYYNTRIRFSGSPWARGKWQSFRIRFPGDRPFQGRLHQFNLESNQGGGSPGHGRLSHYLFRYNSRPEAKAPYSIFQNVRLWVNGQDLGIRDHVEVPNGDTLGKWWPGDDNGDFLEMDDRFEMSDAGYRISSRDGRLKYPPYADGSGDDQETYRWYFNLRQDEDGDNHGNLIDLARVMTPGVTSDAQFDAAIDQYINLESFLRVFAIRMNTDDWDSWGTSRGKNYYLYRPPIEGRWYLIPWDMELTYGGIDAFTHPTGSDCCFNFGFDEVNRMLNRPRVRRIYYGILREMVNGRFDPDNPTTTYGPFSSNHLNAYMTKLDAIGIAGTEAGKPGGYVDLRRDKILAWINPVSAAHVPVAITSPNNGNTTSLSTPKATLGGTAPVEAAQIVVESDRIPYQEGDVPPVAFSDASMTGWSVAGVPLAPGTNNLFVYGFTRLGDLVGDDTIQITYTGTWSTPTITSLQPTSGRSADPITIAGTGFHVGVSVSFDATAAGDVVFDEADPTKLLVTVPQLSPGTYQVMVKNVDGKQSNTAPFTVGSIFIRGDANMDRKIDISDPVKILFYLFAAGQSAACLDAMDMNDDGALNLVDVTGLLEYLFRDGARPLDPFPAPGLDKTVGDPYGCALGLQ